MLCRIRTFSLWSQVVEGGPGIGWGCDTLPMDIEFLDGLEALNCVMYEICDTLMRAVASKEDKVAML